jgi:heptosyltransferase-2
VERLHAVFPQAQLHFLLRKGNENLLQDHPHLQAVLIWDKSLKWSSWWQVLRRIRAERYDKVINLRRFLATGLLTALSGAQETIGFDKNPLSRLFSRRLPHVLDVKAAQNPHEIERNHSLIAHFAGAEPGLPRLYPSASAFANRPQQPYVCLAPASVWFTKQLPFAKWLELIARLPKELEVHLLGGPGDVSFCQAIQAQAQHPKVFVQAGKMSLLESAAWMQGAQMNYVNDSSPLHICSAMNAPVVVFFCSTSSNLGFTPLSEKQERREVKGLACRPCGLHGHKKCPEGHFKCGDIDLEGL